MKEQVIEPGTLVLSDKTLAREKNSTQSRLTLSFCVVLSFELRRAKLLAKLLAGYPCDTGSLDVSVASSHFAQSENFLLFIQLLSVLSQCRTTNSAKKFQWTFVSECWTENNCGKQHCSYGGSRGGSPPTICRKLFPSHFPTQEGSQFWPVQKFLRDLQRRTSTAHALVMNVLFSVAASRFIHPHCPNLLWRRVLLSPTSQCVRQVFLASFLENWFWCVKGEL